MGSTLFDSLADNKYESPVLWSNVADYTYMWWADGLHASSHIFNIQTNRYGLSFDADAFTVRKLGAISGVLSESEVLIQDNRIIERLPDAALTLALRAGQEEWAATGAGEQFEDYMLIESGKYFQRRWITNITFPGLTSLALSDSGLELSSWPDRVALTARLVAAHDITDPVELELRITLSSTGFEAQSLGIAQALINADGSGYIFLPASDNVRLDCQAADGSCAVYLDQPELWRAGEERSVGVIVYPVNDVRQQLPVVLTSETQPLTVEAIQIAPEDHPLNVTYEREHGWYEVRLRNDNDAPSYTEASNDRMERVMLTISNPDSVPRRVRLNFAKDDEVFGITGISALLRDRDQFPLGIPIQISKNWHNQGVPHGNRFEGPWYHGLTMLTVDPQTILTFEYTSVNALWGNVPAASHAQLSLVGWGKNQLWDQAAIGSWGESLTFEPDYSHLASAVLDTRPLMVTSMVEATPRWNWTRNVGGADFLVLYDSNVNRQYPQRMRAHYRRVGPNLTEVTYAGTLLDGKIDLQYTVSLYRTDDVMRGVYRFRYDVRESVEFSRLVLFQSGAENYSYASEQKLAYGDETGMIHEWETDSPDYSRSHRVELTGSVPWVSMHEAVTHLDTGGANRGLVLRAWDSVLGGQAAHPWIAEWRTDFNNAPTSLIDFLPPPGVTRLLPGDYVEAEIVHMVVPQFAADYYGPNAALTAALLEFENTWRMIYREALGNQLEVAVGAGAELVRNYPVQIRRTTGSSAIEFSITGGLGYVPVTFTNMPTYRGYRLETQVDGNWAAIDQSVYGNDFWQVDYDAESDTWDVTYTIPLDTHGDQRMTRNYRLVL